MGRRLKFENNSRDKSKQSSFLRLLSYQVFDEVKFLYCTVPTYWIDFQLFWCLLIRLENQEPSRRQFANNTHPSPLNLIPVPLAAAHRSSLQHVVRDVLINNKSDHGGGHDAEQVGRESLVEAAHSLSLVGAPDAVRCPGVLEAQVLQTRSHHLKHIIQLSRGDKTHSKASSSVLDVLYCSSG